MTSFLSVRESHPTFSHFICARDILPLMYTESPPRALLFINADRLFVFLMIKHFKFFLTFFFSMALKVNVATINYL